MVKGLIFVAILAIAMKALHKWNKGKEVERG